MANLDVYQVVDKSLYDGQNCLNVYFYQARNVLGAPDAIDMADAYEGQLLPLVVAAQSADVLHTELRVTNLFNPSDIHVRAISEAGAGSTALDRLPIFDSVGYRLVGDNGAVRNGSKRYTGVVEAAQTDGVLSDAGWIGNYDNLADGLSETLLFGVIEQFVPVIVKRLLVGGEYLLPDVLGDAVLSSVIDAIFSTIITSQVSRKIGVGA